MSIEVLLGLSASILGLMSVVGVHFNNPAVPLDRLHILNTSLKTDT